jgi:uncharacterized protein
MRGISVEQTRFPGMNETTAVQIQQRLMQRVFSWMFAGLSMTAIIAMALYSNPDVPFFLASTPGVFWGILIAELIVVFGLSALLHKLTPFMATFAFFLYAALNGVTFTLILAQFGLALVGTAFLIAAGMFGLFAFIGYVTKINLTKIGSIAIMAAIGLVLASLVNLFFLKSSVVELVISYLLVLVFCIVTAYDIQNIKRMSERAYDEKTATKLAIFGALMLYLDFIIIFKNLLSILSSDD